MKILVIGGMHGNEPLGLNLVKLFQNKPAKNIAAVFANKKAIKRNCRFIKQDLNRSFPGRLRSNNYEIRRAAQLLKLCKNYDLVLDFHNTYCPNNDCSFMGKTANNFLFDVSSWFGLKRIIIANYECINKYAQNCLSIEISLNSPLTNPGIWYELISKLATRDSTPPGKKIKKYEFVYRMTLQDKEQLKLNKRNLQAFKAIDKKLANAMGVKTPAFPIFIGDSYTPYNYGGLLKQL